MAPTVELTDPAIEPAPRASAPSTPVLMVDTELVRLRYQVLRDALPGVALHYAVKANPAPQLLTTLLELGCRWDIASPGEIDAVLDIGGEPGQMSYGNTIKKAADISYAAAHGVRRFTVDSLPELAKIIALAPGATVLVRLATSGVGADWALGSKFGCPEPEAGHLLAVANDAGHPVGVAFHVGSQQRRPDAWDPPLAAAARLRAGLRTTGGDLAVISLGGGFPATTLDAAPFDDRYGATIMASLARQLGPHPPEVMAEPGRALVAEAGVLETEVVLVAERDGVRWVYLDIGLFGGLAEAYGESIRYRLEAIRDGSPLAGEVGETVLAGPTCDSIDVLFRKNRYRLPLDLRPGDRLRFQSAGAYTTTYSSVGFNGFAPLREVYR